MRVSNRPSSRVARLAAAGLLAAYAAAVSAQALKPASSYLDASAYAKVAAGGDARSSATDGSARLPLLPAHPAAAGLREAVAAERPGLVVEAVFLLRRPAPRDPAAELLASYNALRALSTLAGIQYYSITHGKMRTLYEGSTLVAGPDDRTPVPDRAQAALPPRERLYARQKDSSFGENLYRFDYSTGPGFIFVDSTNLTPIRLGLLPAAGAEGVHVRMLAVQAADGILFYGAASARVAAIPGVKSRLEGSFGNRVAALYAWFVRMSGFAAGS